MQYLTGYFWRQEEKVSLVLKHLVYPNSDEPILFGCLAQGEGAAQFVKKLTDWFYRDGLDSCKGASVTPKSLHEKLQEQLSDQKKEKTILTGSVLLCVGEYFAIWNSLGQQVFLHNTRFGRPNVRLLAEGQQEQFLCGKLQKGVGILVPAFKVGQQIGTAELAECLALKTLTDEKRLEKRLREIGEEAAKRGAEQVSSLLVVTC